MMTPERMTTRSQSQSRNASGRSSPKKNGALSSSDDGESEGRTFTHDLE